MNDDLTWKLTCVRSETCDARKSRDPGKGKTLVLTAEADDLWPSGNRLGDSETDWNEAERRSDKEATKQHSRKGRRFTNEEKAEAD